MSALSEDPGPAGRVPPEFSLAQLERMIERDLDILAFPTRSWTVPMTAPDGTHVHDVIVVGGGHCGLAAAFGLLQEKIGNILVLDENDPGEEGPWRTYARMPDLRTRKNVTGLELGYPNLTFRAYYEAREGLEAYAAMPRISRENWVAYLLWMRRVLRIPVRNRTRVEAIAPEGPLFRLDTQRDGAAEILYARRVVLATGPLAMGGPNIPEPLQALPRSAWHHAYERFDVEALRGRRIGIVGAGATALDNAGELLERGVGSVDLLVRRPRICRLSVIRWTNWAGFLHAFADLGDEERWDMMKLVQRNAAPPTARAIRRVERHPGFRIHFGSPLLSARMEDGDVVVETGSGTHAFDRLILATGFSVDLGKCGFLAPVRDRIALWEHRFPRARTDGPEKYRLSPYLGRHYEFTEKIPGEAPYLRHLYCFNQAAQLSMGPTGRVSGLKYGVRRLLDGIVASFMREDYAHHLAQVAAYNESDLDHPWVETPEESLISPASAP